MNAKDLHLINDGRVATEELERLNPLFREFEERAVAAWIAASTAHDREVQWHYVQALRDIRQHFTTRIQSGTIAARFPKVDEDGV